ncbi:hypothetical protein [Ruegeria atlantica]|uniref:hypothetical protein n=1 Tax=Ruegeria atlantica TaxID=81569 RepID=UPI00147C3638|nr:hypothetical protein [Ruegeria atlantica]
MQTFTKYLFAVALFFIAASDSGIAQETFYNKGRVAHWGLFKDGDYCWMATRMVPKGRIQEITLMVDSESKTFIQLTPTRATKALVWENLSLSTDAKAVSFEDDEGWGINPSKDQSATTQEMLSFRRVNFDGLMVKGQQRIQVQGHFKTKKGLEAYKKMVEHCD